ncbi:MAG TPA: sigma-70 family RNA polymerase sigma factor [Acidimicrobiales bacterium]|jgi:RNA polymerase sigma-70 factor (ECF subfamily)|nr:sigma-70 family RNA polymerase sigma factor [Acidimicrobiales bacterium]
MTDTDREARFSRLVHDHGDAVHRYLRRRHVVGDATDAEDLLADVMAVAWRRLDDIPVGAEAPWLFGVAKHRLSNARHRSTRRDRLLAPIRPRAASPAAEDVAIADLGLREALDQLSDKEREALLLTAWEGLGPEELAIALDVSVNAAAIRLSKAKAHLLAILSEETPESLPAYATGTR